MNILKKNWPILVLLLINLFLFVQNFRAGTFLTGWDNLHPEFNLETNIQRSLFAVWQEYQGVGLLGGMGHASDLVHQIILLILSNVLPKDMLRYFFNFLCLFIGSLGAYMFVKKTLNKTEMISLTAGIFYLLNLSTAQAFYTPWESFSVHFAALPWLLLSSLTFFKEPSKKNSIFLFIVLLLATPANYVPTLFITYVFALITILVIVGFGKRQSLRHGLKLGLIIFAINAFWAIPFAYFTLTASKTVVEAKINQMATETIFLQNKEFGNIQDVMLLKGFWFNDVDPNKAGSFTYLLSPWRSYFSNYHADLIGYILFAVIIIGLIKSLKSKKRTEIAIAALFVFSFTMLATSAVPFSWIDDIFRKIPLFEQAFRFPFTKFSILASLTYAILFALGIEQITYKFSKRLTLIVFAVCYLLFAVFIFPMLDGHLFYEKERLEIPKEYFETFDYFKHQDQNARIANFPQYQFWGWNFYSWGYGGSGFLWYGIHQPILDRAFDVWNHYNENYYFELSSALYAKDARRFLATLNKYQVSYLLIDKNIVNPSSPKSLFYSETSDLLSHIPQVSKTASFGKIDVYKVSLSRDLKSFVFLAKNMPVSNSYQWGDYDQAYLDLGNYITVNQLSTFISSPRGEAGQLSIFYPFRSLFSNKNADQQEFKIKENEDSFKISQTIKSTGTLKVPSYFQLEDSIPARLQLSKNNGKINLILQIVGPKITIGQNVKESVARVQLLDSPDYFKYPLTVTINGISIFNISDKDTDKTYPVTFLVRDQNNSVVVTDGYGIVVAFAQIPPDIIKNINEFRAKEITITKADLGKALTVETLKIKDPYISFSIDSSSKTQVRNCDFFRKGTVSGTLNSDGLLLTAKNTSACLSFFNPNIPLNHSYILSLDTKHQKGRRLMVWTLNEDVGFTPLSTYVSADQQLFVLPPMEEFSQSYSIHIQNESIGNEESVNIFRKADMYFFPYLFLTSMNISNSSSDNDISELARSSSDTLLTVEHPNESLYIVKNSSTFDSQLTMVLSQSYDKGWKAYEVSGDNFLTKAFPFVFGNQLNNHVLVNNWENGWTLDNSTIQQFKNRAIVLVYLPQYFEYFGFVILIGTAVYLVFKRSSVL